MTRKARGIVKPPYRVPSMPEIAALPWNGRTVISTFAGGGGSSLGYRMAGFRVALASEFVDAARETYAANVAPTTILDGRDLRSVSGAELLARAGIARGALDVLDGSPPCAAFSTAGARHRKWGKVSKYSDRAQRTDDLFFVYARLVDEMRPRVFVAENVSGLVKGTAKGYFLDILAALKALGYRVEARVLDASWLGVPQARQRLIFVGVREDLGRAPAFPAPLPYRYAIRDACPWIVSVGSIRATGYGAGARVPNDRPCPTIMAGGGNGMNTSQFGVEADADMTRYATGAAWHALGGLGQSTRYFQLVRPDPAAPCPTVTAAGGHAGVASVAHPYECRKFSIGELKRLSSFPDDYVLTGSYAQQWERLGRAVPPVMMAAIAATVRDRILRPSDA